MSGAPRSLIVYFSMGGSTAKVAAAIDSGLRSCGYDVRLHSLREGAPPLVNECDLLGVGSPVYYYRQPFILTDYLASLPNLHGLPVFTFNTFAEYHWDAERGLRSALAGKGARILDHRTFRGAGTYLPYAKLGYEFSPDEPKPPVIDAAIRYGKEVAARARQDQSASGGPIAPAPLMYRLERFAANRWLTENVFSHFFKADRRKCNGCGLCVKICPMGNIRRSPEDRPVWGRKCILCQMCESKCPRDAITSALDWAVFRPFAKYNVRAATSDSSLQYAMVKHSAGRTERLQPQSEARAHD